MIVTRHALPRRTVLRAIGASVSLPLLDAMVPALTAQRKTAAAPAPRLGFIYTPNGYMRQFWVPKGTGADWEVTRSLQALAPYRNHVTLVSGLGQRESEMKAGDARGPHSRASGAWLTGVHVKQTEGADVQAAQSIDQIAAGILGNETALPSLELAIEQNDKLVGNCEGGYTCAYLNTVSWRNATTPLPMETNPRVVFERLFGDGSGPGVREDLGHSRSILDAVNARIGELQRSLGPGDRRRLDQYLDSVRDVEARIARAETRTEDSAVALPARPTDIPAVFEDHVQLMFDLQALAFQTDMTRVITFQLAREQSARAYTNLGIVEGHHAVSHHSGDVEKKEQKGKIDAYHLTLLAPFIEGLKSTPDGDGSLLDHVLMLYGASLGDPNAHDSFDLPNIVIGSAGGTITPGRHIAFDMEKWVPQCNLLITMLDKVGVPVDRFGDSTGQLREILA